MQDIQSMSSEINLAIDRVGVRGLKYPLQVRDKEHGMQRTVALIDLSVDLPAAFKGTHMSRFIEALESWSEDLDYAGVKKLLENIKSRLNAKRANIVFSFPYFLRKKAPASGILGTVPYECTLVGDLTDNKLEIMLKLNVPVMTVCPCSKAISVEGAHSQRANILLQLKMRHFHWIEEFIAIAESSASSAVYSLLKRQDEKFVTEDAFAHPTFVEDVVRNVASKLLEHDYKSFKVEVESFESIHAHNAFACIEMAWN